jgi:atypical dual specificity phosphatase
MLTLSVVLVVTVTLTLFWNEALPESGARVIGRVWHHLSFPGLVAIHQLGWLGNPYDYIADNVMVGRMPYLQELPLLFEQQRVHAIVNLCDEAQGALKLHETLGIKQLHLPTVDHFEPSLESLIQGVEFIERHRKAGEVVYIHCRAGVGRSAAVAFCWLVKYGGYSPTLAQAHLLRCRPRVRKRLAQQANVKRYLLGLLPPTLTSPQTS